MSSPDTCHHPFLDTPPDVVALRIGHTDVIAGPLKIRGLWHMLLQIHYGPVPLAAGGVQ